MSEYKGVRTDHPRIVEAIQALAKQGKTKEQISKVVGMPYEVVDKYVQKVKR